MKRSLFINLFICIIAFIIFCYWLYSKIFKNYLIIELVSINIDNYQRYFEFMLYFCIYILSFMLIVTLVSSYLSKKEIKKTSKIEKMVARIVKFIEYLNVFFRAYVIMFDSLEPKYKQYILKLAKFALSLDKSINNMLIMLFIVLPRIIVLEILLIEIYMGVLHYYFYSLLLLLIPFFFKIILFILKDSGPRILLELKEIIYQTPLNKCEDILYETSNGIKKCKVIKFSLTPEYSDLDLDEIMHENYYPALFIEGHIKTNIYPRIHLVSKITLIIYYLITAISFAYLLQI